MAAVLNLGAAIAGPISGKNSFPCLAVKSLNRMCTGSVLGFFPHFDRDVFGLAGFLIAKFGRKWIMVCYAFPMAVGFALFVIAGTIDDHILIYIGRFLTGRVKQTRTSSVQRPEA